MKFVTGTQFSLAGATGRVNIDMFVMVIFTSILGTASYKMFVVIRGFIMHV